MSAPLPSPVDALRSCIDDVDREIARLLQQRAMFAIAVARVKSTSGEPAHDTEREADILRRLEVTATKHFNEARVRAVFAAILAECREVVIAQMEVDRSVG